MPFEDVAQLDSVLRSKVARLTVHMDKCQRAMSQLKEEQSAVEITLQLLNAGAHVETVSPPVSVVAEVERAPVNAVNGAPTSVLEPRPSADEMQAAYDNAPARFTIREIIGGLDARFAENDLARSMASNFLRRLEDAGTVQVVERGSGRRPSSYVKNPPGLVRAVGPTVRFYPAPGTPEQSGTSSVGNDAASEFNDDLP